MISYIHGVNSNCISPEQRDYRVYLFQFHITITYSSIHDLWRLTNCKVRTYMTSIWDLKCIYYEALMAQPLKPVPHGNTRIQLRISKSTGGLNQRATCTAFYCTLTTPLLINPQAASLTQTYGEEKGNDGINSIAGGGFYHSIVSALITLRHKTPAADQWYIVWTQQ